MQPFWLEIFVTCATSFVHVSGPALVLRVRSCFNTQSQNNFVCWGRICVWFLLSKNKWLVPRTQKASMFGVVDRSITSEPSWAALVWATSFHITSLGTLPRALQRIFRNSCQTTRSRALHQLVGCATCRQFLDDTAQELAKHWLPKVRHHATSCAEVLMEHPSQWILWWIEKVLWQRIQQSQPCSFSMRETVSSECDPRTDGERCESSPQVAASRPSNTRCAPLRAPLHAPISDNRATLSVLDDGPSRAAQLFRRLVVDVWDCQNARNDRRCHSLASLFLHWRRLMWFGLGVGLRPKAHVAQLVFACPTSHNQPTMLCECQTSPHLQDICCS